MPVTNSPDRENVLKKVSGTTAQASQRSNDTVEHARVCA